MTMRVAAPPAIAVYARGPFQAGGVVILEADEGHHLRVRRVADGGTVRLVDGRGGVATARISFEQEFVSARVVATTNVPAPPVTEVFVGAGDRDRFLDIVEKATELGATRIVPLVSERSLTVAARFQSTHLDKAQRRAREALKQCGAGWLPQIAAPLAVAELTRVAAPGAQRFLAHAEGRAMPALREAEAVQWVVGPEGGFTDAEVETLRGGGYALVALGRSTLRFDTAVLAALAITAQARLG